MTHHASIPHVGAQDPELRNSPIAEEEDEDNRRHPPAVPGEPVCFFNGAEYRHGAYVVKRHPAAAMQLRRLGRIGRRRSAQP